MKIKLVGQSYQEDSLSLNAERTINLYPIVSPTGKETTALYGTPGKRLFAHAGTGSCRGCFAAKNGRAFEVIGSELYEIDSAANMVVRGALKQSAGAVTMDENGFHLAICDGATIYILTYETNEFVEIKEAAFMGASTVTCVDGYFIVSVPRSGKYQISGQYNGLTWDALDFKTAESDSDNLLRVMKSLGQLWLFGAASTEVHSNTGASAFPFSRINGALFGIGILAPMTAVSTEEGPVWVGRTDKGAGGVYKTSGFSPVRISTPAIEAMIQAAAEPENMAAYIYEKKGRTFYVLTGGGLETSLCFDFSTQSWHERASLDAFGDFIPDRAICCMYAFGRHLVGDRLSNKIYVLEDDIYEDAGEPLVALRIFTHLSNERMPMRYSRLEIDLEAGVGLQEGQGSDPVISMRMSKDAGHTWTDWEPKSMGKAGQNKMKAVWRKLGIAEQITFQIRIADPVKRALIGAYLS